MDEIKDRTAIVTGASRGIGRAIALALAAEGADVVVSYMSRAEEANKVVSQITNIGRRAIAVKADISSKADAARIVGSAQRELGTISILVNNAGIGYPQSIDDITEQDWDRMIAVNLKSAFLMIQAVLPDMRKMRWGRIISLSSVAAQIGGVVGPHYAASKAGIIGLTHYYAAHLAKEGITVNAIAPGPIATEMVSGLSQLKPELIPVGRFGTVDEVAAVALLIAQNGYITGQTININGGRYFG